MNLARTAAATFLGAAAFVAQAQEPNRAEGARFMKELMSGRPDIKTAFSLHDSSGRVRTLEEFRGKVVLVYFGYTTCPDVCPTDLAALGVMLHELGPLAQQVQAFFITLDPARDTPKKLGPYADFFHPSLIALRGSAAETRRVARAYKAYYANVPSPGGTGYLIDHMGLTYLLDRDGNYRAFCPPGTNSERMGVMVREALGVE